MTPTELTPTSFQIIIALPSIPLFNYFWNSPWIDQENKIIPRKIFILYFAPDIFNGVFFFLIFTQKYIKNFLFLMFFMSYLPSQQ